MNKFLFGQCTTAPCKQVKNTCKTKLNYLNPKAEIPMSNDAHHILKFQHLYQSFLVAIKPLSLLQQGKMIIGLSTSHSSIFITTCDACITMGLHSKSCHLLFYLIDYYAISLPQSRHLWKSLK